MTILTGCAVNDGDELVVDFPDHAALVGQATGIDGTLRIDCRFYFLVDRLNENSGSRSVYHAVMGGDAERSVIEQGGTGVKFWGNAFDSVQISFPSEDRIVIRSRIHEPKGTSRFWDEFLYLEGEQLDNLRWSGDWQCYPLDTRGDTIGIAAGTWTLENVQ